MMGKRKCKGSHFQRENPRLGLYLPIVKSRGTFVSTVLMGREQSRDLRRHSSSFSYHVISPWRPPSCFAAMLFCIDTITRRHCGARSKVKGYRPFALIQLPVRVRVSNPNGKFEKKLVNCKNNCQLGLGLVTLMKGHRHFLLIQLPVRVRVSNPNYVVCSEP